VSPSDSAALSELDFDRLRFDARMHQHPIGLELDASLHEKLLSICDEAERAVRAGATLIVLDDR